MLKLLENQDDEDLDPSSLLDKLVLDPDPAKRGQQLQRLRRLVDHKNYQIRLQRRPSAGDRPRLGQRADADPCVERSRIGAWPKRRWTDCV